jgi:hypothetical protein
MAALKDNINEMIRNLQGHHPKNAEQDWLKTNLAKFSRMLQGQKDLLTVGRLILSELAPVVSAQQGVFYIMDGAQDRRAVLKLLASYAYKDRKNIDNKFKLGEGLVGSARWRRRRSCLTNVPATTSRSRRASASQAAEHHRAAHRVRGQVKAVMELASFDRFNPTHETFLDQLTESIGIVLNTIEANMRTEDLLKQSQSLARELQSQQEELSRPTPSWKRRPSCWPSRTSKWSEEQGSRAGPPGAGRKGQAAALTSKYKSSSSRTCRTSCAPRSTRCSSSPTSCRRTPRATSTPARSSSPRRSTRPATTCSP